MIKINKNGTVEITKVVKIDDNEKKKVIRKIVVGNIKDGFEIHKRWSMMYNAYDLYTGDDIRKLHSESKMSNKPRIDYVGNMNWLNNLLYVAYKLFNDEIEGSGIEYI